MAGAGEEDPAAGSEGEELDPVVEAQQEQQVEPLGPSGPHERGEPDGSGQVRDAEQHHPHAQVQVIGAVEPGEEPVRRRVALQQVATDAVVPNDGDHDQCGELPCRWDRSIVECEFTWISGPPQPTASSRTSSYERCRVKLRRTLGVVQEGCQNGEGNDRVIADTKGFHLRKGRGVFHGQYAPV